LTTKVLYVTILAHPNNQTILRTRLPNGDTVGSS